MKKVLTMRNSINLLWSSNAPLLLTWLEQFTTWFIALGVDWTKLPWAVIGTLVSVFKTRKDAQKNAVHTPFWEWLATVALGAAMALAGWKDVEKGTGFSPELSAVIAGLVAWWLADKVINAARKQVADEPTLKS